MGFSGLGRDCSFLVSNFLLKDATPLLCPVYVLAIYHEIPAKLIQVLL